MKLLVIGASGQVGHYFSWLARTHGHHVLGTSFARPRPGLMKLDITRQDECNSLAHIFKPDAVVLAGAMTNVERCESEPALARAINVEGARNVLETFAPTGAAMVYISTEYVFDGKNGPYRESDPMNPVSEYGKTKAAAEQLTRKYPHRWLVLRTTVVYGYEPEPKNFFMQLRDRFQRGEPMRVPSDQLSSPTFNFNLAQGMLGLIERDCVGTFHVAGNHVMSRVEFAHNICTLFNLTHDLIQPVTTAELGQKAARPLNAGLIVTKAEGELRSVRLRPPHEALKELKQNWDTFAASWERV